MKHKYLKHISSALYEIEHRLEKENFDNKQKLKISHYLKEGRKEVHKDLNIAIIGNDQVSFFSSLFNYDFLQRYNNLPDYTTTIKLQLTEEDEIFHVDDCKVSFLTLTDIKRLLPFYLKYLHASKIQLSSHKFQNLQDIERFERALISAAKMLSQDDRFLIFKLLYNVVCFKHSWKLLAQKDNYNHEYVLPSFERKHIFFDKIFYITKKKCRREL